MQHWVLIPLMVLIVATTFGTSQGQKRSKLPSGQNGYPLLEQAAQKLVGTNPTVMGKPYTRQELETYVQTNQAALQTLRQSLKMPCTLPVPKSQWELAQVMPRIFPLRELARLLSAEGKLHELKGDYDRAAQSYMDAVRLGLHLKGGTMDMRLVTQEVMMIGQKPLLEVTPRLSAKAEVSIAKELTHLLKTAEPPENAIHRSRQMILRILGEDLVRHLPKDFVTRPTETLKELRSMPQILQDLVSTQQDMERIFLRKVRLYRAVLFLTALELSVGAFQQKGGGLPQSLQELVLAYLPELPADPVSQKPFVYRVMNGKPQIYSVGLNGKDEGGKGDDVTARLWERTKDPAFKGAYFSP